MPLLALAFVVCCVQCFLSGHLQDRLGHSDLAPIIIVVSPRDKQSQTNPLWSMSYLLSEVVIIYKHPVNQVISDDCREFIFLC